jgi:hypothetical protein
MKWAFHDAKGPMLQRRIHVAHREYLFHYAEARSQVPDFIDF